METQIGKIKDGEYYLRDRSMTELILQHDWVSTIWLAWTGRDISPDEHTIISGCLVACIDHGVAPPSAQVTRITASCAKPIADCVAAGLLTLGSRHGNAAGAASVWLRATREESQDLTQVIDRVIEQKIRLSGFGHMEYEIDPRTTALSRLVKTHLLRTPHLDLALEVSRILSEKKGKLLPLNIDGVIGAIVADLDAPAELADVIFLVARAVGLSVHAMEERVSSTAYRRG